jgi:hypothetical protein
MGSWDVGGASEALTNSEFLDLDGTCTSIYIYSLFCTYMVLSRDSILIEA